MATVKKYEEIIRSVESEIGFQNQVGQHAIQKRERAKIAKISAIKKPGRERVYRARVALANQEVATVSRFDAAVVASAPQGRGAVLLEDSAQAVTRYNKWGARGVALRPLLERAFDDLA